VLVGHTVRTGLAFGVYSLLLRPRWYRPSLKHEYPYCLVVDDCWDSHRPPLDRLVSDRPLLATRSRLGSRPFTSPVVPITTLAGWVQADRANRGQFSALTCRVRHHSGWLILRQPSRQRPDQRPQLPCLPPQWQTEPTPTKRTEAREAPSPVLPATTVAVWTHADQVNKCQSSALTCRARHRSGLLSPCRPRDQIPVKCPHLSCPPHTVAGWAHTNQANRGQTSALNFSARLHSCWLSSRRPSEQRPDHRPHLSCPPPQWLAEPRPTEPTEARAAPSPVVPASPVAGWAHVDQANTGQCSVLTCCARHDSGWLGPLGPREQRSELRPHVTCPPPQWLA
jgi:hypothetical protein